MKLVAGPVFAVEVVNAQTNSPMSGVTITANTSIYLDAGFTQSTTTLVTNALGVAIGYAPPGTYTFTTAEPLAAVIEPVQVLSSDQNAVNDAVLTEAQTAYTDTQVAVLQAEINNLVVQIGAGAGTGNSSGVSTFNTRNGDVVLTLADMETAAAAPNGFAVLNSSNQIPTAQIPSIALNSPPHVVASQAAMLALSANVGDVAVRTDTSVSYMLQALPASTLGNWVLLAGAGVTSVNSHTGVVVLTAADVSAASTTALTTETTRAEAAEANAIAVSTPLPSGSASTDLIPVVTGTGPLALGWGPRPELAETYTISGPLGATVPIVGQSRYYVERSGTITAIRIAVGTAPTGASLIVDVLKNGTTIWGTNPANRPTIAAAGFTPATLHLPDSVSFSPGDFFTVNVVQVGSSVNGSDLTVQFHAK